jgi:hypothetical protein
MHEPCSEVRCEGLEALHVLRLFVPVHPNNGKVNEQPKNQLRYVNRNALVVCPRFIML